MNPLGDKAGRTLIATIFSVSLTFTSVARAGDPKDAADLPATHPAANQSVGIEEPARPEPHADVNPKAAEAPTNPTVTTSVAPDPGVQLPPRGERRLRTPERTAPTTGVRPSPAALGGLWPLFAVTALIGAIYVLMRRYRGGTLINATGAMRVLGRLNLSPKHQLALVQVGKRILVVGISSGDMRTLHVIDDAEEAALLAAGAGSGRGDGVFAEWLGREGQRFDDVDDDAQTQPRRGPSGVSELLKKVRTMQTQ